MADTSIKAKDIMTKEVIFVTPSMSVQEAARVMNIFRIGGVPVVVNRKVIGMLCERDIMQRVVAENKLPSELKVEDVMTSPPKVLAHEDEDLNSLAQKMVKYDVTRIPILDKNENVVGIVTNRDVLKNSVEFLDILLEQAKVKGLNEDYVAFSKCDICHQIGHLYFKDNKFICDSCIKLFRSKHK
ncbi:MAG: CBS domain-containing protein [Candidatus Nanoarchaeia archaeon]